MLALANLCAGPQTEVSTDEPPYSCALRTLHRSIVRSGDELIRRMAESTAEPRYQFTPLVARRLLEECAAAIIGRLDPVRLLVAFNGSKSADFKMGDRNESSISWSKDVVADFKPANGTWSQETLRKGIVRSLLDGHLGSYVFSSAHTRVVDGLQLFYESYVEVPEWAVELQKVPEGQHVLIDMNKRARSCYSFLSKGIHHEFFSDGSSQLVDNELRANILDAIYVASTAALYSNMTDSALRVLPEANALNSYHAVSIAFTAFRA